MIKAVYYEYHKLQIQLSHYYKISIQTNQHHPSNDTNTNTPASEKSILRRSLKSFHY